MYHRSPTANGGRLDALSTLARVKKVNDFLSGINIQHLFPPSFSRLGIFECISFQLAGVRTDLNGTAVHGVVVTEQGVLALVGAGGLAGEDGASGGGSNGVGSGTEGVVDLVGEAASGVATSKAAVGKNTSGTSSASSAVGTVASVSALVGSGVASSVGASVSASKAGARASGVASVTKTTLSSLVRLAGRVLDARDVGSLASRADAEDRALPLVALGGKVLVLSGLGGDATRKLDVLEDGIVLSHGDVDALVGLNLLLLLLTLGHLLLEGSEVALVDVLDILGVRVALGLSSGTVSLLLSGIKHGVKLLDVVANLLLDNLLEGRAHDLEEERLEEAEEKLVVRLLQLDVQVLNINIDGVDLEEVGLVGLVRGLHSDLEAQTSAAEEDVHDTLVGDAREALLLLDVVGDVAQVALHARNRQHDLILVAVLDLLAAPAPVVVAAELENVRGKVVTLNDEVLNDDIHHVVGELDTGDGNVADVLKEGREDDISQVLDQVRLEGRLAVLIVAKVVEELVHRLGEGFVLRVLVELLANELELVDDSVGVIPVAVTEQELAVVVKLVPLGVGVILEDVALLLQAAANELVHVGEPALQLGILLSIAVDLVDGVGEVIE
jgi:hypothetical protein